MHQILTMEVLHHRLWISINLIDVGGYLMALGLAVLLAMWVIH